MACQVIRKEDGSISQVLAENGKESKLFATLKELSDGNEKSALRLWAQTYTPTFKAWFGQSKVVDENGEPLIVYHGTGRKFEEFDFKRLGETTEHPTAQLGFFFSSKEVASLFVPKVQGEKWYEQVNGPNATLIPTFLSLQKPANITAKQFREFYLGQFSIPDGDSLIVEGDLSRGDVMGGDEYIHDNFVIYDPNQVKSVFNKGQFSSYSDNIYESRIKLDGPNPFDTEGKMKTMLDKLSARFNISYTIVNDPHNSLLGWFNAKGVVVNMAKAQADTPFHEFLHPFIDILKKENPDLYAALARELLYSDPQGMKTLKEVSKAYGHDLDFVTTVDEALVTRIGQIAAEKYQNKPFTPEPTTILGRFLNWIKNLFKTVRLDFSKLSLNTKMSDIADMIVDDMYTADLRAAFRNADVLTREQRDTKLTYEHLFERIKDKLAILKATLRTRKQGEAFRDDIENLNAIFENSDEITSINNFVVNAISYVEAARKRFESLRAAVKDPSKLSQDDISHDLYVLGEIQQLLNVYDSLNDIQLLYYKEGKKSTDDIMAKLSDAIASHRIMAEDFKSFALSYITEWLYQYIEPVNESLKQEGFGKDVITKDEFVDQLEMALRDISTFGYLLGASINSQDAVSAAVALALKDVTYENHKKNVAMREALQKAFRNVQGTPLYTTKSGTREFNIQFLKQVEQYEKIGVDEDGSPIYGFVNRWAFHMPYNYDQFEKNRILFFQKMGPRPSRANFQAYKTWQKEVSKWYAQNTMLVPDANHTVENKRNTLTRRKFDQWLLQNTIEIDEEMFANGTLKSDYFKARGLFFTANQRKGTFRIYSGELISPATQYRNKEFHGIMQNEYARALYHEYRNSNSKLGVYALKYGIIPQVARGKTLKETGKSLVKQPLKSIKADPESSRTIQRQDETEVKHVPIKYTGMIDPEFINFDLLSTVTQFSEMATNYDGMTDIEPNILILKTILNGDFNLGIRGRQVAKTNSKGKQIINAIIKKVVPKLSKEDMLNKRLNEFIDDVMYGESEILSTFEIFGKEFSMNKIADKVGMVTSLSTMALNLNGGINNVVVGNFNNMIEAIGGRFWGKRDWLWAHKEYWANIHHTIGDLVGMEDSLLGHLSTYYDVPQGEFLNEFGSKVSQGTLNRLFKTNNIFFIQNGGEHEIQLTGMLALLRSTKVKTKSGEEISLYEAWQRSSDGSNHISPFNNPDIIWTEQQDKMFRNRLHAITKTLQGIYNKFDKSVLARRWYGKLMIKFRKYLFSSFKSLYGGRQVDYELGTIVQGNWNLFVEKIWKDLKDYKWGVITRMWTKEGYNELEKAAINKTLAHFAFIAAAWILAGIMGDGPDEERPWLDAELALQMTRFSADITQYINPSDFLRVIRNPAASVNLLEKLIDWFGQLFNPTEIYKRKAGIARKGDNKLLIKTLKILPISRQVINALTPNEQRKFYQMTGGGK